MHIDYCIPHTGLNSYCAILNSAFSPLAEAERSAPSTLSTCFSLISVLLHCRLPAADKAFLCFFVWEKRNPNHITSGKEKP